jgi:DNA polymerase
VSEPNPRDRAIRSLRTLLTNLLADGIDYLPRPPRAAAPARRESEPPPREVSEERAREIARAAVPLEPSLFTPSSDESLDDIRTNLGDCTRCRLSEGRAQIVFGEGSPEARVVFVGEGPGAEEDRTGRPFVGRAGELLTRMIESVGWKREDVYICNVVKCRPPGNREPKMEEVAACRPFLERQLRSIRPRAIVTLGRPASQTLLGRSVAITKVRGIWQEWEGIPLMPTFHPAYLLRSYTRETRQAVWDDLRAVRARVEEDSDA